MALQSPYPSSSSFALPTPPPPPLPLALNNHSTPAFAPGQGYVNQYAGGNGSGTENGSATAPSAPAGNMQTGMQSGPFHYPSAPYAQPVPAAAQFQLQQPPLRHSTSPQTNASSPASAHHSNQRTPPVRYPMAAPPFSASGSQNLGAPSPQSPQSPGAQNREQQRINLLFEINIELLQEVNRLQNEGKGGHLSPQQAAQARSEGKADGMACEEYIQALRRVQANLAYLMPKAQQDPAQQAKVPPGPAHMTAPAHMSQLHDKYERLRELFPGWHGLDHRSSMSVAAASPQPVAAANGMTAPNSSVTPTQM